jgi:hypothetical protein
MLDPSEDNGYLQGTTRPFGRSLPGTTMYTQRHGYERGVPPPSRRWSNVVQGRPWLLVPRRRRRRTKLIDAVIDIFVYAQS